MEELKKLWKLEVEKGSVYHDVVAGELVVSGGLVVSDGYLSKVCKYK
jgi:hypothetical protein